MAMRQATGSVIIPFRFVGRTPEQVIAEGPWEFGIKLILYANQYAADEQLSGDDIIVPAQRFVHTHQKRYRLATANHGGCLLALHCYCNNIPPSWEKFHLVFARVIKVRGEALCVFGLHCRNGVWQEEDRIVNTNVWSSDDRVVITRQLLPGDPSPSRVLYHRSAPG